MATLAANNLSLSSAKVSNIQVDCSRHSPFSEKTSPEVSSQSSKLGSPTFSSQRFLRTSSLLTGNSRTNNGKLPTKIYFGDDLFQDSTKIIIPKSILIGLTPSNNNTAESLFIGFINLLKQRAINDSFNKIGMELWGTSIEDDKLRLILIINIWKLLPAINNEIDDYTNTINPMDY